MITKFICFLEMILYLKKREIKTEIHYKIKHSKITRMKQYKNNLIKEEIEKPQSKI